MKAKVLVTGASGVLGNAVYNAFKKSSTNYEVKGLAHSRPTDELIPLDLTDEAKVKELISSFEPDWVVHCAAERRPDVAAKNPEATRTINGLVPLTLSTFSASPSHPFTLIYISTDYVFDGTSPPYEVDAKPKPLQFYGETKYGGEQATLGVTSEYGRRVVLRVPVLYGPVKVNSDSAINILLDVVRDQSGKQYTMDHYQTRYPTNVLDIADFLVRLADTFPNGGSSQRRLPPILHYSAPEPYTKYEMCLILAALSNPPLSHAHITPDETEPIIMPGRVGRPRDCQLSVRSIEDPVEEGGLGMSLDTQGFKEWWEEELLRGVSSNSGNI
ncbi:NAD-P-binding protein [Cantharellus anzutake]|uniref:NAD-P-binding protein n=1 Tax=Cantharellus anzutake TaxID=1750568 RepID=UPI001908FEB3|nr:NAD-P-binding protein [Cantharellus anzutake]KAF8342764.1 NAD-P-binding protein [Cantharellus anzutake]